MRSRLERDSSANTLSTPQVFLNAYELSFPSRIPWQVSLYDVEATNDRPLSHSDRTSILTASWAAYRHNKQFCPGPRRFILDVGCNTIAVPSNWELPHGLECDGYRFVPVNTISVNLDDPEHDIIIQSLLREAIKREVKALDDRSLGTLWQYYNDFCQVPDVNTRARYFFPRKFGFRAVSLKHRCWALQIRVSTQTIDGQTFADYLVKNDVEALIDLVDLKSRLHSTRRGQPVNVSVLRAYKATALSDLSVERLDLYDPNDLVSTLRKQVDRTISLDNLSIGCRHFKDGFVSVPADELRLILDTEITQDEHRETILEPDVRVS